MQLILSPFVFIMISDNFCICICSANVTLYVDGYALETVVVSTFNDCELDKAIHLSGNVYND